MSASSRRHPRTLVAVLGGALLLAGGLPGPALGSRTADAPTTAAMGPAAAAPTTLGSAAGPAPAATPDTDGGVPASVARTDQVVVTWRTAALRRAAAASDRVRAVGGASGGHASFVRALAGGRSIYRLDRRLGQDAKPTLAALAALPGVARVEPDPWVTADALPNDPRAAELWGLKGAADGSAYGIDATGAWATTRGAGVVVAVIDTGITAHPDLAGQTVAGYDLVSDARIANDGNGRDADPSDPGDWITDAENGDPAGFFRGCGVEDSSWHGTHVAGTVAAIAGNGTGVFGGAPDARVQPVRVLGKCGGYTSDIADGITWASGGTVPGVPANPTPARVLNLSLGGFGACPSYEAEAIAAARARGSVVVVAAGNSDMDVTNFNPANCPGAFSVAASDVQGLKPVFSNVGETVDISAPGAAILSTINLGTTSPGAAGYASYSGTSMAAPHVAAVAALITSAQPSASPDRIEGAMLATTTAIPDGACLTLGCGTGIVHAARAVAKALAGDWAAPTVSSMTVSATSVAPGTGVAVGATFSDPATIARTEVGVDGAWTDTLPLLASLGSTSVRIAPVVNGTVTQLSVGPSTCVAVTGGRATCWGWNMSGQLGQEPNRDGYLRPVPIDLANVAEVAAGATAGCARLTNGTVWCWGQNQYGELGNGEMPWGRLEPVPVSGIANATALAVGNTNRCALLADRTIACWGSNFWGSLGNGSTASSDVPVAVTGITTAVGVANVGPNSYCALLAAGTVRCWGGNEYGMLGNGAPLTPAGSTTPVSVVGITGATAVYGGGDRACARVAGGALRCWGHNANGELGDGTRVDTSTPVTVAGVSGVIDFATGTSGSCAMLAGGTVACWGRNVDGSLSLGDGQPDPLLVPTEVPALAGFDLVRLGIDGGCGRRPDHTIACWGDNQYGQLGNGTYNHAPTAATVAGIGPLALGTHAVCVRATDRLGNRTNGTHCASVTVTNTPGPSPTPTPSASASASLAPTPTPSASASPSATPRPSPTPTPSGSPAPSASPSPSATPSPAGPEVTVHPADAIVHSGTIVTLSAAATGHPTPTVQWSRRAPGGAWSDIAGATAASYTFTVAPRDDLAEYRATFTNDWGWAETWPALIRVDDAPPGVVGLSLSLRAAAPLSGSAVPLRLAWFGTDTGSGVAGYEVERTLDGGRTWVRVASPSTPSASVVAPSSGSARYRVRAIDAAGNRGAWVLTASVSPRLVQDTSTSLRWSTGWSRARSSSYSGGSVRYARSSGRTVSYVFTGRAIGVAVTRAPSRGRVKLYLDGRYVTTVDAYRSASQYRSVLWTRTFGASGRHTLKVVTAGPSTRPRADLDAIVVLR